MTGFYMKCNIGLKWVIEIVNRKLKLICKWLCVSVWYILCKRYRDTGFYLVILFSHTNWMSDNMGMFILVFSPYAKISGPKKFQFSYVLYTVLPILVLPSQCKSINWLLYHENFNSTDYSTDYKKKRMKITYHIKMCWKNKRSILTEVTATKCSKKIFHEETILTFSIHFH